MAEVDAADERDVVLGSGAPEQHELLVMAPAAPHAFVEHQLTARLVHLAHERGVVLLAEVGLARMRTPEQPAHVHVAPGEVGEDLAQLGAGPVELLVGIALPIGEVDPVARLELAQLPVEPAEVLGPVDEHLDVVALGPRLAVAAAPIDLGGGVAPLVRGQEPVVSGGGDGARVARVPAASRLGLLGLALLAPQEERGDREDQHEAAEHAELDHRLPEGVAVELFGPRDHDDLLDRGDDPHEQERFGDEPAPADGRADRAEQLDEDEREQQGVERGGGGDVDAVVEAVDQLVDRVAEEQAGTGGQDRPRSTT